jgi:hypothetical protein
MCIYIIHIYILYIMQFSIRLYHMIWYWCAGLVWKREIYSQAVHFHHGNDGFKQGVLGILAWHQHKPSPAVGVATQASALFPQVSPAQRLPSASPWLRSTRWRGDHMLSPDLGMDEWTWAHDICVYSNFIIYICIHIWSYMLHGCYKLW